MERMEEKVPGVKYEPLQYFLSESNWDWRPVNNHVAKDADNIFGGKEDSALFIDESGIPKKGKMSVGVSRQWCGQLGKTDNCQVVVFATLGYGRFSTPIDCRLYLPKSWTDDKERCLKAKARGWLAWHHHMTMVMMAMLFMVEQRLYHQVGVPLLSCADITTLLKSILPRRDVNEDEVIRQLCQRHEKRQASIDFAYEKQRNCKLLPQPL
ncbi:MAG: transposase [Candidatus Electrothrix sp. YB6]